MDKQALLMEISGTLAKADIQRISAILYRSGFPISELIELTFYPQKEVAFRAAWILEHLALGNPDDFKPYIIEFLDRYPQQMNQSCRRHFAKIMAALTDSKDLSHMWVPEKHNLDNVAEKTFEWLIDPKTPVAVKVYCMEVLFNLHLHVPWIKEELEAEIIFLLHDGQPALQSRGKAVLQKLKRL
jgi:hypothetical protein